jgi:glycosyltransferase involved in cell wall biosynthesis
MNSVLAGQKVAVVIPVFNERDALSNVLDRLRLLSVETIVVDDGSSDGSAGVARAKASCVAVHAVNLGQGAALQTGIELAKKRGAEVIITFDSDGQHNASDIPLLVQALHDNHADFALGSRFLGEAPGIPWVRRAVLKLGVIFTRALSGIRVTDTHNGLRAMTRRGAESIHLTLNRMEHASQFLDQVVASGLRYVEVPVRITYTSHSLAKGQASSAAMRIAAKLMVERLG